MSLDLTLLAPSEIPASVRRPLDPKAPRPLQMMAARGKLPLSAPLLLTVLYQYSLSKDKEVREAAMESFKNLPEQITKELIKDESLDPRVLDRFARTTPLAPALLGRLVLNKNVADETISHLAGEAPETVTEIIAGNHVRLLRHPEIIERLYNNPQTRQVTFAKVLELAQREGIVPAIFGDLVEALDDETPGVEEAVFKAILERSTTEAIKESEEKGIRTLSAKELREAKKEQEKKEKEEKKSGGIYQEIQNMNVAQKMRLAALGGRGARSLLIQDSKRTVYMAAIKSPRVSLSDVQKYATNRALSENVISYIASNRQWIRYYPIALSLANNPKCSHADALRFINKLRLPDLKAMRRNKNISAQLARNVKALLAKKSK